MAIRSFASYQTRIGQFISGFVFLALGYIVVSKVASGNVSMLKLGIVSTIGLFLVFLLDKDYWIVCPLSTCLSLKFPGIPFSSEEIGILFLLSVFFARAALHRDPSFQSSKLAVCLAVPYFTWVVFIFCLNPVGMHIFGAEMIGGRHYFRIVAAFVAFCVLSRIELSERGVVWLFWSVITLSSVSAIASFYQIIGLSDSDPVTRYYLLPFGTILLLLLSRYDLNRIIASPTLLFVCGVCAFFAILSGKRTLVGQIALAPFLLMFLRRREFGRTIIFGTVAAMVFFLLALGHGTYYELPFSVQRALSFLPGHWNSYLENYGFKDSFRDALREKARERAFDSPWVGRKGFAMDINEISWYLSSGATHTVGSGHAISGNWHSKFWGMWADFGIVAPIAWYFFSIGAFVWTYRQRIYFSGDGPVEAFYRYWTLLLFFDLVTSYGHSALTPFSQWPVFGFLLALNNMRRRRIGSARLLPDPGSQGDAVPTRY